MDPGRAPLRILLAHPLNEITQNHLAMPSMATGQSSSRLT